MEHSPGPWRMCGCGKCGQIWSENGDHPIAQVISGEWGDEWPEVKLVERGDGKIGKAAVAYTEKAVYGRVPPEVAKANGLILAAAIEVLEALEAQVYADQLWEEGFYREGDGVMMERVEAWREAEKRAKALRGPAIEKARGG